MGEETNLFRKAMAKNTRLIRTVRPDLNQDMIDFMESQFLAGGAAAAMVIEERGLDRAADEIGAVVKELDKRI